MKLFFVLCLLVEAQSYQRNEEEGVIHLPVPEEEEGLDEAIDIYDRLDDLVRLMFGYPLEYLRQHSGDDVWSAKNNIVVAQYYYHRRIKPFYARLEGLYGSFINVVENFAKNLSSREETRKKLIEMWNHTNEGTQKDLKDAFFGFELIDDMANNRKRSYA